MGLKYLDAGQIHENKDAIRDAMAEKSNYFVRSGDVVEFVRKYASKESQIVEIGAGGGELAQQLLKDGFEHLNLIDIDDYINDSIRGRVRLDLRDVCFQTLPYEDNSIDLVLAVAIVEHLENPYLLFRESLRILKPGGKLFVAIPHIFSIRSRIDFLLHGNLKGYNEGNNHITLFTKAVFNKTILKNFRLLLTKYSNGYIRLFGRKKEFALKNVKFRELFADKVLFVLEKK